MRISESSPFCFSVIIAGNAEISVSMELRFDGYSINPGFYFLPEILLIDVSRDAVKPGTEKEPVLYVVP